MTRATLRIEREAVTFDPGTGESVRLAPIVVATPGEKGTGPAIAVGESEHALALQYDHLVESGKLPGPIEFVQPGGSPWWDALLQEPDWQKGAGSDYSPPAHGENVLYVVRPLEAATWSRRYIEPLIHYVLVRHLSGLTRTFQVFRPCLHLEVSLEVSEQERRFVEQTVRNHWGSFVRATATLPRGYRLGEMVMRYGASVLFVALVLGLWALKTVRLPHDIWFFEVVKVVGVPLAATVALASWTMRRYYLEGLGRTRWQLVRGSMLALLCAAFCAVPAICLVNSIKTRGVLVYEGTVLSPLDPRSSARQVLTFEDDRGQEFELQLRRAEYQGLRPGTRARYCYQRGWLGIPFVRASGPGPRC